MQKIVIEILIEILIEIVIEIVIEIGTGYIENSRVRSMIDFFDDFSQNFSERAVLVLKNSITISITKIGIVEPVTLKKPCLFRVDFNHDFNHDFLHNGTPLLLLTFYFLNLNFQISISAAERKRYHVTVISQ